MSGGGGANREAKRARQAEEKRQAEIRKGTDRINTRFGQFDNDFFNERRQSYVDYATPQLEDQYDTAGDQLTFALARAGQLDSSTRGDKESELQKLFEINRQGVVDGARAYETEARTDVEDARTGLIQTLQATGDAKGAAQGALSRARALSRAPAFNPLEQLFVDFTAGLGTQAQLERRAAYGGPQPRYNTGLFGPGSRSVVNS